jgi:hypothetical protein
MYSMRDPQSSEEISDILARLVGRTVAEFSVLGINSLKSVTPAPTALAGTEIVGTSVRDRILELRTQAYLVQIDLQRAGRLIWFDTPPSAAAGTASRPTVRLLTQNGDGIDFAEPAKTKRISVHISKA